jgi:cobyrinic acid a,c-diamide synthase
VQAGEHKDLEGFLNRAGAWVAEHLDVDGLVTLARPLALNGGPPDPYLPPLAPLGQRIAVAADPAFAFSYPLVIDGWRDAGAEVVPFSPLAGEGPDGDADAVYLPGGYPELHAGALAAASGFMDGLASATARGAVVFGECGGYMVLGRGLIDADGTRHAMAGLLALETSFAKPKLHLGYRRAVTVDGGTLGKAGTAFRGHEFHYAEVIEEGPGEPLFHAAGAEAQDLGPAGLVDGQVCGSFIHLIDRE